MTNSSRHASLVEALIVIARSYKAVGLLFITACRDLLFACRRHCAIEGFKVMALSLCSWVLLLGVMAVSSSIVMSEKNRAKTAIVSTSSEPSVGFDEMEPALNHDPAEQQPLYDYMQFDDPNNFGLSLYERILKDEMKRANCSVRASCKKFRSSFTSRDVRKLQNCMCDELCETFDDCCLDYVRNPNSSVETIHLRPEAIACQDLSIYGSDFEPAGYWAYSVVVRCPANYSEPYIREKCELGNSVDADLFYRLPVNGRTSKVLYRNFYCAICNGDMDVIYWTGKRDVCHLDYYDQEPDDSLNTTTEELIAKNSGCEFEFVHPKGYFPRRCRAVMRQCSANWTDRKTARKCEKRSQLNSYVYHEGISSPYLSMAFRNKHCAVCNHFTEAQTSCVGPGEPARPAGFPPQFSIIIDLNAKTQAIRNNYAYDEPDQSIQAFEMRECDLGFVYDPYSKICRFAICPKAYRHTDAGCEPNPDFKPNIMQVLGPQTNLSCSPMIQLNKSEYIIMSNHSAYIFGMDSIYTEDQYALEPPYLYICPPFTRQYNVTLLVMFQFDHIQSLLSFVGMIVSLVSLLIQFVVYMIFPELRNTPGKCIVCLVVSLFVGQLAFLFVAYEGPVCLYIAAAMHFGFLAAFFWMNALAFDFFRTFAFTKTGSPSSSGSNWKRFLAYSVYAWLTTAMIVGLCITMDVLDLDESFRPHYGEGVCWITSQTALLMFFVVPVGAILIFNVVFFCITILCICRERHAAKAATPKTHTKGLLLISIKLFFIMGLTWLFGFMASLTEWTVLWYAFIVFNSLQGAFLCLIFLCTRTVYRLMKKKWSPKSRNSTTAPLNYQRASTKETIVSKTDTRVVAKGTRM